MAKTRLEMIRIDAGKAVNYDARLKIGGGYELKHAPSSYGIAIKWLLGVKRMTYAQFAKAFNGSTAQNVNHWINRTDKRRFSEFDIEQICKALKVRQDYFIDLSEAIEEIMETMDGNTRG